MKVFPIKTMLLLGSIFKTLRCSPSVQLFKHSIDERAIIPMSAWDKN